MSDCFSKNIRSKVMRAVKSSGNKSTELRLIDIFKENKISGWRRKYIIVGHPDFVFPRQRIAVFTDGCFWHGHKCRNVSPKNNKKYWLRKIKRNIKHDEICTKALKLRGWKVIRIWECELNSKRHSMKLKKLIDLLKYNR